VRPQLVDHNRPRDSGGRSPATSATFRRGAVEAEDILRPPIFSPTPQEQFCGHPRAYEATVHRTTSPRTAKAQSASNRSTSLLIPPHPGPGAVSHRAVVFRTTPTSPPEPRDPEARAAVDGRRHEAVNSARPARVNTSTIQAPGGTVRRDQTWGKNLANRSAVCRIGFGPPGIPRQKRPGCRARCPSGFWLGPEPARTMTTPRGRHRPTLPAAPGATPRQRAAGAHAKPARAATGVSAPAREIMSGEDGADRQRRFPEFWNVPPHHPPEACPPVKTASGARCPLKSRGVPAS